MNIDLRKRVSAIVNRVPLQNSSSASKNKLAIMPDGKISTFNGAVSYPELQITPDGGWLSQFQSRWNRNILQNEKCGHCRAAYICGQGSAFSSYLQYGDFKHTPALHCEHCKTLFDYVLDTVKTGLVSSRTVPYGYVVTCEDIRSVFPTLFTKQ
jgi:radical SAM protein with 4Fe4S-binding SPASM domain